LKGLVKYSFFNETYSIFCDKETIFLESFVKNSQIFAHKKN
jgi:hypothetical protein